MLAAFQGRCPICTSHVHVVAFTDDWDDIKVMDETACFACTAYASAVLGVRFAGNISREMSDLHAARIHLHFYTVRVQTLLAELALQ